MLGTVVQSHVEGYTLPTLSYHVVVPGAPQSLLSSKSAKLGEVQWDNHLNTSKLFSGCNFNAAS